MDIQPYSLKRRWVVYRWVVSYGPSILLLQDIGGVWGVLMVVLWELPTFKGLLAYKQLTTSYRSVLFGLVDRAEGGDGRG